MYLLYVLTRGSGATTQGRPAAPPPLLLSQDWTLNISFPCTLCCTLYNVLHVRCDSCQPLGRLAQVTEGLVAAGATCATRGEPNVALVPKMPPHKPYTRMVPKIQHWCRCSVSLLPMLSDSVLVPQSTKLCTRHVPHIYFVVLKKQHSGAVSPLPRHQLSYRSADTILLFRSPLSLL